MIFPDHQNEHIYDSKVNKNANLGVQEKITINFATGNNPSLGSINIYPNESLQDIVNKINNDPKLNSQIKASLVPNGNGYVLQINNTSGEQLEISEAINQTTGRTTGFLERIGMHPSNSDAAGSLSVREDLLTNPSGISSGTPEFNSNSGEYQLNPAANDITNAMAKVFTDAQDFGQAGSLAQTSTTLANYAATFVGAAATETNSATSKSNCSRSRLTHSLKEATLSGVDRDEELAQLIIFSRVMPPAPKHLSCLEMLDMLLNMVNQRTENAYLLMQLIEYTNNDCQQKSGRSLQPVHYRSKAQNYSGYGMSASSIVSLEATLGVTSTFMENNKITEVEIKTMNTSMEAIQDAINDFKSALTSFSGITGNGGEGTTITDNTGGKLTFTSNDPDDYIGKSIIIDGTEYKFANNSNGNNIDISGATTAEEIMTALKDKLPANADYDFDGTTFTYPLGTVDNNSTIIKANGVTTGSPVTTTTGGSSLTPDYTGGELTFTNDNVADYLGQTITINGVQYTFANDGNGNNIDISGAANAEDVMNALKDKLPANADFKFEGNKFTFPLYTINGTSSVLNVDGVETGEPYTMSPDQARELRQLQNSAFSALKMLVDSLNTFANGKYLFGGGVSSQAPVDFPFSTLDEFQAYYDGLNIQYPSNSSADLSNFRSTQATREISPNRTETTPTRAPLRQKSRRFRNRQLLPMTRQPAHRRSTATKTQ
ncbi:MAG: hypothetical protein ACLSE6_07760 [Alphaproteobacteria bacterium]